MKFRILVLALVTALFATTVAFAHNSPSKGKPVTKPGKPTSGPNCRPRVKVVLKGTLANDPVAGDTMFMLTVTKANRHGRAYVSATQPITVNVDVKTKVRRKAPDSAPTKTLDSLAMDDVVKLDAKACKADLKNGGTPDLTARHVKAHPAPAPPPPPAP
ncbi:MAG TPA: hypothetical protein VK488_01895 [Gaiellaceae bacterium]|nr:hypothetical protein [Gaiellaceae bacterium]